MRDSQYESEKLANSILVHHTIFCKLTGVHKNFCTELVFEICFGKPLVILIDSWNHALINVFIENDVLK